jgi:hypothetical protein
MHMRILNKIFHFFSRVKGSQRGATHKKIFRLPPSPIGEGQGVRPFKRILKLFPSPFGKG